MLTVIGSLLEFMAIGMVATSIFLLVFRLFRVTIGGFPARPPSILFCIGGVFLGLLLFAASVIIGFRGYAGL